MVHEIKCLPSKHVNLSWIVYRYIVASICRYELEFIGVGGYVWSKHFYSKTGYRYKKFARISQTRYF